MGNNKELGPLPWIKNAIMFNELKIPQSIKNRPTFEFSSDFMHSSQKGHYTNLRGFRPCK